MRVSGLDKNGDWRFGRGRAVYLQDSDAIAQNVVTRLRSFQRDWFLDIGAGIDWITLLGRRNSKDQIIREVERVVLETDGVLRLTALDVSHDTQTRRAMITVSYDDIYQVSRTLEESLET